MFGGQSTYIAGLGLSFLPFQYNTPAITPKPTTNASSSTIMVSEIPDWADSGAAGVDVDVCVAVRVGVGVGWFVISSGVGGAVVGFCAGVCWVLADGVDVSGFVVGVGVGGSGVAVDSSVGVAVGCVVEDGVGVSVG